MAIRRKIITALIFIIFTTLIKGQGNNTFSAELIYMRGHILPIYNNFPTSTGVNSIEGRFNIKLNGRKYWHQFFHYPEISINALYSDFGNKDVLGHSFAIYPTINRIKSLNENLKLTFNFGGGISYFDTPYNSITNPGNIVIGSRFTAIIVAGVRFQKQFGKFALVAGGDFRHFSDGHYKVPNVGANTFFLSGGVKYYFSEPVEIKKYEEVAFDSKLHYYAYAGFGMHEIEGTVLPQGGPKYPVYFTALGAKKRLSYKSRLLAELQYGYYTDYHDLIINGQLYNDKINRRSSKVILLVGHELIFDHFTITVKAGANVYYPIRKKLVETKFLENRVMDQYLSGECSLNYYLFDARSTKKGNPFIGYSIKTIGGKADYFAFKAGVLF